MRCGSECNHGPDEIPDDERDDPQERDISQFGDSEGESEDRMPCPSCGQQIWDMADRCSFCGTWIDTDRQPLSKRTLIIAGSLIGVILLSYMLATCNTVYG